MSLEAPAPPPDSPPCTPHVVIVGGGLTGLALAYGLAQAAIPSLVLERSETATEGTRDVLLHPRAIQQLAQWDLLSVLRPHCTPIDRLVLLADGQPPESISLAAADTPSQQMLTCPQGLLEDLLQSRLAGSPYCQIRQPAEVVRVLPDAATGEIVTEVRREHTMTVEAVRSPYVAGCDGSQSLLRRKVLQGLDNIGAEQTYVILDVRHRSLPLLTGGDLGLWWCADGRAASSAPLAQGWRRWVLQLGDEEDGLALRDPQALSDYLSRLHPGRVEVTEVGWFRYFTASDRLARTWCKERSFLIGEAAHLINPWWGQGLSASLEDACSAASALIRERQSTTDAGLPAPSTLADALEGRRTRLLAGLQASEAGALRDLLKTPQGRRSLAAYWTGVSLTPW